MTDTTRWIGPDDRLAVDMVGFLWCKSNSLQGWERWTLEDRPPYTNQSHQPRLTGWCGTYNDIATHASGVWKVVRMARNGRAFIRALQGVELRDALNELGYPELIPNDLAEAQPSAEALLTDLVVFINQAAEQGILNAAEIQAMPSMIDAQKLINQKGL